MGSRFAKLAVPVSALLDREEVVVVVVVIRVLSPASDCFLAAPILARCLIDITIINFSSYNIQEEDV